MAARGPRPAPVARLAEPLDVLAAREREAAQARAAAYLGAHGVLVPGEFGPARVRRLWAFARALVADDVAPRQVVDVEVEW